MIHNNPDAPFIGITDSGMGADSPPRVSTLQITDAGLCVLGNLPHGYTFRPTTSGQRDKLCNYLQSLDFAIDCDSCGANLAGYLPGVLRCDNCTDKHGLEFDPAVIAANNLTQAGLVEAANNAVELNSALIDIAKGVKT